MDIDAQTFLVSVTPNPSYFETLQSYATHNVISRCCEEVLTNDLSV